MTSSNSTMSDLSDDGSVLVLATDSASTRIFRNNGSRFVYDQTLYYSSSSNKINSVGLTGDG